MQCDTLMFLTSSVCLPSTVVTRLPTLCRLSVFSWVRDTSYDAVLVQSVKWNFPPEMSVNKSEITTENSRYFMVLY
jgi:hypothetical protein